MTLKISSGAATQWLVDNGYPYRDILDGDTSSETYNDGGWYGVEIPAINRFRDLELIIKLIQERGLHVARFNETHGSFLLSDGELTDMLALCRSQGYGLLVSLGPRPEYDIKASFYRSDFGLEQGRRVNNNDAIRACAEEALRLTELGCRGIIVYDIGVLRILSEMRRDGFLPADLVFKTSTHCAAANPIIAKIFAENGADSVTTTHDLGLPVLREMRRLNTGLALDVPTDVYKSKGGFIRFYELAEILQLARPVMLKMGASVQGHPYDSANENLTRQRVDRVACGLEILDRFLPTKVQISTQCKHYCLPAA